MRRMSRNHPELSWLSFSLHELLAEMRETRLPGLSRQPRCWFAHKGPLACIETRDAGKPDIWLHSLLNHPETPRLVLGFILTHELLHLEVPGRDIAGKWCSHPPEFWERERALCPERRLSWQWVYWNFWECLRHDRKRQGMLVKAREAREFMSRERVPLSRVQQDEGPGEDRLEQMF